MVAGLAEKTTSADRRTVTSVGIRKWVPGILYIAAAVLLLASIAFPYWGLVLEAPQYPDGLAMRVFVNRMTGDEDPRLDEVREIDGLNHYIGMQSLYNAAKLEQTIALPGVILMAILLGIAAFWRKRWAWLLTLPVIIFPFVFLGDLWAWMSYYGNNLDPYAPLSSAIEPFTPPILGEGVIGQFKTIASVHTGWYLALAAAILVIAAWVVSRLTQRTARS